MLAIAATRPLDLAAAADQSPFYRSGQYDNLYRSVLCATRKVCLEQSTECTEQVLRALQATLVDILGGIATHNFFSHLQLLLGLRRLRKAKPEQCGSDRGDGPEPREKLRTAARIVLVITVLINLVELAVGNIFSETEGRSAGFYQNPNVSASAISANVPVTPLP